MFDEIRSALQYVAGGAEKLRNVLSLPDASTKLLRFVSDDIWGSRGSRGSMTSLIQLLTYLSALLKT
jgi:hypothetical protein